MSDLFGTAPTADAVISDCGLFRYRLGRVWDADRRPLVFVMLNPSKADAEVDDPTITRCIGFAKAAGAGGIDVVNLFAFRATDPDDMAKAADPIGPLNNLHIRKAAEQGHRTVVAWGAGVPRAYAWRVRDVMSILRNVGLPVWCLGITKAGQPRHPLFVKGDVSLAEFGGPTT